MENYYEIDILVNDKPIRKYAFNNKLYIEARNGIEYQIRIKNNTYRRVLAVCSVDSLNVITGLRAKDTDTGYVINGYNSLKLDGFRVNNNTVAKFEFNNKTKSYAATKKDGSDVNVGVIGIRLFDEYIVPSYTYNGNTFNWNSTLGVTAPMRSDDYYAATCDCDCDRDCTPASATSTSDSGCDLNSPLFEKSMKSADAPKSDGVLRGGYINSTAAMKCSADSLTLGFCSTINGSMVSNTSANTFDMGTKYGKAKESKVIETEFTRNVIILSQDIYYASRESLISMGIVLDNVKQISFPKAFDNKYATPPKGWTGH